MMQIHVNETTCSGCRACEVACVARHDNSFGTSTARIRVAKFERLGIDRPAVCQQCADKECVTACPVDALSIDAVTGATRLDAGLCVVCSACADACTFNVVRAHPATGMPLICDLCDGDPACVRRCVTGALSYGEARA